MITEARDQVRCWAIVPAAGAGSRMNSEVPKQYLSIGKHTVLEHTLRRLAAVDRVAGIVVALSSADSHWSGLRGLPQISIETVEGGAERHLSVYNALRHLAQFADARDWVLVHDAARPCVRVDDINNLITRVSSESQGGLLGLPVRDTMKRADNHDRVTATVERDGLWHALTPQMFRLGELSSALDSAISRGLHVTDDAAAMELADYQPLMVAGHADNIKLTRAADLPLVEYFLTRQEQEKT